MTRWWLALALTVASATASAQPAPMGSPATPAQAAAASAQAAVATGRAMEAAVAAEKRTTALAATRTTLHARYDGELKAVDRLKQQRASWRRDRELRAQLATANEIAKQLATVTRELAAAQRSLATARRAVAVAIDAELATGASGARAQQLARAKAQVAPPTRQVRKIVLPDTAIDPLADPEELDQQAAALRESEVELLRQVSALEAQGTELERRAELRKQHDRAIELDRRDDNQPRRNSQTGGARTAAEQNAAVPASADDAATDLSTVGANGGFESDARVELAEVIDATTIDTLARAQRSGDPAQRAQAARATRDAVAKRLEQLKKKRLEIEARAKRLRKT